MCLHRNVLGWKAQPVSSIGPRTDESGHWAPITAPEAEEDMWVKTDPEMLWQQQVDDNIWENIGASLALRGRME